MKCPTLNSERLIIRPISSMDLVGIHDLHSLPETDEYNTLGIPKNKNETASTIAPWIQANEGESCRNFTWALLTKEGNNFIGLIAMNLSQEKTSRSELWYKLNKRFWKKGYAIESVKQLLMFGFHDLNLHRIEAGCAVENIASIKLLEKVGMINEGRRRQRLPLKSGWSDGYEFGILKSDYLRLADQVNN